jgi:hypothetical protein
LVTVLPPLLIDGTPVHNRVCDTGMPLAMIWYVALCNPMSYRAHWWSWSTATVWCSTEALKWPEAYNALQSWRWHRAGNELQATENHELLALNGTLSETLMLE